MVALSFVVMYILMYAMVDDFANVYNNLNQAYMAGLMAAPMIAIELVVMRSMYRNMRLSLMLIGASAVVAGICFLAIRRQAAIGDDQFLRSMIPHHAGAILMCENAPIERSEIKELCRNIIASQRAEITQMRALLER